MNTSDELLFIASAFKPTNEPLATFLHSIAIKVRRMERTLDELTAEAQEEERLLQLREGRRRHLRVVR